MNNLYIVATPIGNTEDITIRALKTLLESDVVACEDTRHTGQLIATYEARIKNNEWNIKALEINKDRKLISFYDEVEGVKALEIVESMKSGKKVCLVSDGGTPLISDPGFKLVKECLEKNINIISVPGPTAFVSALVSSGLPVNNFLFLGFLPVKHGARKKLLEGLKNTFEKPINPTVIFYESPHRIYKTLEAIKEVFGDIEIVIARELTKVYEEIIRDKVSNILRRNPSLKGEITLLFNILQG